MSEEWIELLERVNELRDRVAVLVAALPDPAARRLIFDAAAAPVLEGSRIFGGDQQECIEMLLEEIMLDHGLIDRLDIRK